MFRLWLRNSALRSVTVQRVAFGYAKYDQNKVACGYPARSSYSAGTIVSNLIPREPLIKINSPETGFSSRLESNSDEVA